MSNRATPRTLLKFGRNAFSITVGILFSLSGCGGGGGGGGGGNNVGGCTSKITPPGNPVLATVAGFVFDTAHNPVLGASVTVNVPGAAGMSITTDSCGKFVITNVPLTANSLTVGSPNPVNYYNYANYNGKLYDLINCTLPLPTLSAGTNAPFTEIDMFLGGPSNPPPQPPTGCPT